MAGLRAAGDHNQNGATGGRASPFSFNPEGGGKASRNRHKSVVNTGITGAASTEYTMKELQGLSQRPSSKARTGEDSKLLAASRLSGAKAMSPTATGARAGPELPSLGDQSSSLKCQQKLIEQLKVKQRQRLELNSHPTTDQEKLKEFKDQRPQVSLTKIGVKNERNPRAQRDVLFSDFGISYSEVSELGKLIYSS